MLTSMAKLAGKRKVKDYYSNVGGRNATVIQQVFKLGRWG